MSTHNPPNSIPTSFAQRKRIYVACVHCRKRKVKCVSVGESQDRPCERCTRKGLACEYLAVCEEQAKATSTNPGPQGSVQNPSPPFAPATHTQWNQPPQNYGGQNMGTVPNSGHNYYAQPNAAQFNSVVPSGPSQGYPGGQPLSRPYPPAGGFNNPYNYGGMHTQRPHTPLAPPGFSQQPTSSGSADYNRYFSNFGLPAQPNMYINVSVLQVPVIAAGHDDRRRED
ncbi:hypothetical protein C8R44DRAFT_885319 [Mycena epipterygia]|nr:hypothetical protein C8R44DRAFT_885319 [Mycena epipterygia]